MVLTRYFKKISGYKVVNTCARCGKRFTCPKEERYCEECRNKED